MFRYLVYPCSLTYYTLVPLLIILYPCFVTYYTLASLRILPLFRYLLYPCFVTYYTPALLLITPTLHYFSIPLFCKLVGCFHMNLYRFSYKYHYSFLQDGQPVFSWYDKMSMGKVKLAKVRRIPHMYIVYKKCT